MRLLFASLFNLLLAVWLVLTAPLRLFAARRRPAWVSIKLKGDPPYRRAQRRFGWLRRRAEGIESIEALRKQLHALAPDPGVRGVVLELDGLHVTGAKREAIVEVLEGFRKKGKQVVGYAVTPHVGEYELLCAADRILLNPAGRLELTGFAAEISAIGAGLEQLGVGAHFVRRGEYKTAPELFTRRDVSDAQRRTIEGLLEEHYQELVGLIAQGRKLGPDEARKRIDEGPYSARRAHAGGLCDGLVSEPDLADALEPGKKPKLGPFAQYAGGLLVPPVRWRAVRRKARVSVVPVQGMIVQGDGATLPRGPALAGSDGIIRSVRAAAEDRSSAIVLFINSPGGSAVASELILDEVKRAAKKKPLVAYFDRVAASGGYMAAIGAPEIGAGAQAIAGSIGVFAGKFDAAALFQRLGIHRTLITRGEHAGIYSSSRPFTPGEHAALEADIEEMYQSFLEQVAASRKKTKDEVHALGEGRIFSGRRAQEVGLVDWTGSFDHACRRALELAHRARAPGDYELALYSPAPRRFPWLDFLQSLSRWELYALCVPSLELGFGGPGEVG